VTREQAALGSDLRRHRESREISLAAVAESTKIKQSLLAALERGDAAHWPPGIFGRGFLREYALAIGLPPEPVIAEFLRLFPQSGDAAPEHSTVCASGPLRLTLAEERQWSGVLFARQAAAALVDCAVVVGIAALAAWLSGAGMGLTVAITALAYSSIATGLIGRSPMLELIQSAAVRRADRAKAQVRVRPSSRDLLHIVSSQPRLTHGAIDHTVRDAVEHAARTGS
jgi:transcriptional regulator with XRE-family HTH domain